MKKQKQRQMNNDYLVLPKHLWDVYRSAGGRLFHYPSGKDITPEEREEIVQKWEESERRNGVSEERIANSYPNVEVSFDLPPQDEE